MPKTLNIMKEIRWAFNVATWKPSREEWLLATSCVSSEEKRRVHQFVFKNDAMLAMAGRLLIRGCINEILGIPWQEIKLDRTEKSKPFLVDQEDAMSFNVSHQGNYSVAAASNKYKVGVDVMKIDRPVNTTIPDFFTTMRRQFTPEEWQVIKSKTGDLNQMASFYRFWCLKESYVKAVGTGLGTSTAEYMRFKLNSEDLSKEEIVQDSTLYLHGNQVSWKFQENLLDDEHIATVAFMEQNNICSEIPAIPFTCITFEHLTRNAVRLSEPDPKDWLNFSNKKERNLRGIKKEASI